MPASDVAANLVEIHDRIAGACARAGRDPAGVRLVAISKRIPTGRVLAGVLAGQLDLGENRLQDALARQDELRAELVAAAGADAPTIRWHFVGHLQRNKASKAAGRFALIHGVHSADLARRLDRKAGELGTVQPVLLQVNVTAEPQKDGLATDAVEGVACEVAALKHLDLQGLMCMARFGDPEAQLRRTFATLRQLRDQAAAATGRPLPHLSMGMSGNFEAAIAEGATLVRIGTAVFGPREG
jgi:pyridoxal phosphate enzyme (YggS family)